MWVCGPVHLYHQSCGSEQPCKVVDSAHASWAGEGWGGGMGRCGTTI